jgi:GMP synthase-like glutamine amidotransferase
MMAGSLNISCLVHVPFEGPAIIADWAGEKKHRLHLTKLYEDDPFPDRSNTDMVVLMGGPMSVFDYHVHPRMQEEIDWTGDFIRSGKPALGICLGAQIIAASLGAKVYPGKYQEIGWHNVEFLPALGDYRIWKDLPESRKAFHWHGDTFDIPRDAIRIAASRAYPNQGFIFGNHVIALQFHLEAAPASVRGLAENCRHQLVPGPHVQTEEEILEETRYFESNQRLMFQLLDYLRSRISS